MATTRHNPRLAFQFLKQRYQSAMDDHINLALAALREDWQPVRAVIAERISQLEDAMSAAEDAGEPVNLTWLAQEGRLQQLLTTIDQAASGYGQTAADTIGDAQAAAVDVGSQAAQDLLQATVPPGMSYTFGVPPQGALDAMASALDDSSPLSGLLMDSFGADAAATAQQALFAGVALGQSAAQIASMLTEATDMSAQRAEVIARTEVQRAYRDAQMANYRANSDVVNGWMWSTDFSDRSCGACIALDGTIHDLSEDLDDHINGRCSALPVTNSYASILGQLGMTAEDLPIAGLTDTSARYWTGQKGADWFASQSDAFQARILGPAKFAALQHGDISLTDLVGIRRSAMWGDSIYEKSLRELGFNARDYLTTYPLPSDIAGAVERASAERDALAEMVAAARAEEATAAATTTTVSEAQTALDAAQARVDTLREQFIQMTTRDNAINPYRAAADLDAQTALWDLAKAQAAVDLENGGRGAIIFAQNYSDPFKAMDQLNATTQQIFGRALTRDELAGLVGGPQGSHVIFDVGERTAVDGMSISLHGPSYDSFGQGWQRTEYEADRLLSPTGRGNWMMYNTNFSVREDLAGQGLGAQIFSDEANTLSGLGVRYIETNAAGAGNMGDLTEPLNANGYYTWPRFGYLGHLPQSTRDDIQQAIANGTAPAAWRRYTTIQQLMRTAEGRNWWKTYGTELDGLRFDLREGSLSQRILANYLDEVAAREASATEAAATTEAATAETTVTFTSDAARTRLTNAFGQSLEDSQVAALAGAPPGSVVEADKYGQITVTTLDYTSSVYVHAAEADGLGPTLLNWRFEAPDGTNNIPVDAESLGRQVRQANELGVEGIHMKARSASADFEQLPLLGYDAPIAQVLVESQSKTLPAGLEGVQSLQELLTYPAGRDWWHANGMNPGLDFDPHPGSLSWRILDEHLQSLGLEGLGPLPGEVANEAIFTSPVTAEQIDAVEHAPLGRAGQQMGVNAAFTAMIDDQRYLVKSFSDNMLAHHADLMAAMGPPEYQAAAEAASWRIANAVGLPDTMLPTYLMEYQGERQVIMPYLPNMQSYANTPHGIDVDLLHLSQDDLRDMTLFNYLIGDTDAHYGNLLYDPETNVTVGIDHSLSLRKAAATLEVDAGPGQVWTMLASEEHNPYDSLAWSSMAFDRQQLQTIIDSEPQVVNILRQMGLDDGIGGVQARFSILRRLREMDNPTYMDLYDLAGSA